MTRARASNLGQGTWRPVDRPPSHQACTDLHTGPHNRCSHRTAPPPGTRYCALDPACPYRPPADTPDEACPWHGDADHVPTIRWRELMGATERVDAS